MHGPAVVGWLLVGVCVTAGGYTLVRLRRSPPAERRLRQAPLFEGLMALAMAAMALPTGVVPPPPPEAFAALFGMGAVWAVGLPGAGVGHRAHHLVESSAMVYMSLVMVVGAHGSPGAHHHPAGQQEAVGGSGEPLLTAALLAYFAIHALTCGSRVAGGRPPRPRGTASGGATACRAAVSLAMFTMLLSL